MPKGIHRRVAEDAKVILDLSGSYDKAIQFDIILLVYECELFEEENAE